jgi:hypothetical protein
MSRGKSRKKSYENSAGLKSKPLLSRADIIGALARELSKISFVQAFWEGGAVGWGRVDAYSDIDAYLLVDEGRVQETFEVVEKILVSLSPITQKYVVRQNPWPGLSQAFYRLESASEFLVLDLGILTDSSPDKFLEPEIHGRSVFYFNKKKIEETASVDMKAFEGKSRESVQAMIERFGMFSNFVEKEIKRGNNLEALEYYRTLVIPSLVQALRLKYSPMHYDFRMRYVHYDLPSDVVERLERLSFVSGKKDLETKHPRAIKWFNELISDTSTSHP